MSFFEAHAPVCSEGRDAVDLVVKPARKSLGEFTVARALPSRERRMVGPFVFFDHMGPAEFAPGQGIQVRPHPHIGIATITYLFEGQIVHRDSLGYEQTIAPGAVNLMVAGRGIVHSERAGDDLDRRSRLHGIQSWLALPDEALETDPEFIHYPSAAMPEFQIEDAEVRLVIGEAYGQRSPVKTFVDTIYLECGLDAGGHLTLPAEVPELAVYVVEGEVDLGASRLSEGTMAVLSAGARAEVSARTRCRLMVLGGAGVGPRRIWWNFVAPTKERIEQAKSDWKAGRFPKVAGDDEFIPLPE